MQYTKNKLGIDIAKASFEVFLIGEGISKGGHFSNDRRGYEALSQWLQKQGVQKVHACMESTGRYGEGLAEKMYEQGHELSIVNAYLIKEYRERRLHQNKTDKDDARLMAEYCLKEEGQMQLWEPLSEQQKHLKALVRRLDELKEGRRREENRLESIITDAFVHTNIRAHIAYLTQQIKLIETEITSFMDRDPDLKSKKDLLSSIPGVGDQTIQRFLAEVPNINKYKQSKQLVAHFGLNPCIVQSGSSVRKQTHISKRGQREMRCSLYMPAVVARRWSPVIKDLNKRMEQTGHRPMQIIVAVMRKLLVLMFGVLKSGKPFDPLFSLQPNAVSTTPFYISWSLALLRSILRSSTRRSSIGCRISLSSA